MEDEEEWVTAAGFPDYEVSTFGRIRRKKWGQRINYVLKSQITEFGYRTNHLPNKSKKRGQELVRLHVLICTTFHGPAPAGHEPNHKDADKSNNRPDNLEWVTRSQNIKHAWNSGLHSTANFARGERNGYSKLTEADVRAIYSSPIGPRPLGRLYGVSHGVVRQIKLRLTWKHLDLP